MVQNSVNTLKKNKVWIENIELFEYKIQYTTINLLNVVQFI